MDRDPRGRTRFDRLEHRLDRCLGHHPRPGPDHERPLRVDRRRLRNRHRCRRLPRRFRRHRQSGRRPHSATACQRHAPRPGMGPDADGRERPGRDLQRRPRRRPPPRHRHGLHDRGRYRLPQRLPVARGSGHPGSHDPPGLLSRRPARVARRTHRQMATRPPVHHPDRQPRRGHLRRSDPGRLLRIRLRNRQLLRHRPVGPELMVLPTADHIRMRERTRCLHRPRRPPPHRPVPRHRPAPQRARADAHRLPGLPAREPAGPSGLHPRRRGPVRPHHRPRAVLRHHLGPLGLLVRIQRGEPRTAATAHCRRLRRPLLRHRPRSMQQRPQRQRLYGKRRHRE